MMKLLVEKFALSSILVNLVKFILFNSIVAWIIAYFVVFFLGYLCKAEFRNYISLCSCF